MIKDDERLFKIVSPVVSEIGLSLRTAKFYDPKEFQASWRRSGNDVDMMISDYLIDAPDDVLKGFSETVAETIIRKRPRYRDVYLNWIRSDDFINSKRKIYLRRSRNLIMTPIGKKKDIIQSLDRLLDLGLLIPNDIENSFFSWTKRANSRKVGFCSPMMRVVGISRTLDEEDVPEYVLDYVVYHESLHLAQGYRPGERAHDQIFRTKERRYPRHEEAETYLRNMRARKSPIS